MDTLLMNQYESRIADLKEEVSNLQRTIEMLIAQGSKNITNINT